MIPVFPTPKLLIPYSPFMEVTISHEEAVTEGEDVQLLCNMMEANPEKHIFITWFKKGEVYKYLHSSFSTKPGNC